MSNFISKTLKAELLFLSIFTLLSCYAFYFSDSMPDNFMSISSGAEETSFFVYYLSSFVVAVGYFFGPWLFIPFIILAAFYSFLFSKRDYKLDPFGVLFLLPASLGPFIVFSPELVGDGLLYLTKTNLKSWQVLSISFISSVLFLAFSMRGGFKSFMIKSLEFLGKTPEVIWRILVVLNPRSLMAKFKAKKKQLVSKVNADVPKLLKKPTKEVSEAPARNFDENSSFARSMRGRESKVAEAKTSEARQLEFQDTNQSFSSSSENLSDKKSKVKNTEPEQDYFELITPLSTSNHSNTAQPEESYFEDIIQRIEEKLSEFKIEGKIVNILKGPVVDTFELDLGSGVKVSKVTSAEKDLSMALLGAPIRIVYPMIGRATVGIEVPRNPREVIYLSEVLQTKEFVDSSKRLPIAMGKDAFGETFVVDLASMPHMLVAGATGAGKSVFINTLLVSLLVKKSPDEMKLILIDPKQLELALYSTLPHLVMPVITDAKTASISLLWACQEMERRYSILKEFGVRNIEGFNQKLKRATPDMLAKIHQHYENEEEPDKYELPYLVIIVDEFADLILTKAGKEIENNICRLAAKARAAGIHLVLATQRPSVDVITGLIKSNFPTRVSFRVTSSVDSRTILNSTGAEKLLGKGDMLYRHGTENRRVHSSFVNEDEIEVLTKSLSQMGQVFHEGAIEFVENGGEQEKDPYAFGSHISGSEDTSGSSNDDLYSEAVRVVVEHRTASASMLQRRLRVGYNRAANLIEEMEAKGVVGPAQGSKRRKVLVSSAPSSEA